MTRESTDTDTAEQVIDSFRILAGDKVRNSISYHLVATLDNFLLPITSFFYFQLFVIATRLIRWE